MQQEKDLEEKNNFEKNFYLSYLSGTEWGIDYADFFVRHDNRITNDQEQIIEFSTFEEWPLTGDAATWSMAKDQEIIEINEPKDAWNYFLWLKMEAFNNNL